MFLRYLHGSLLLTRRPHIIWSNAASNRFFYYTSNRYHRGRTTHHHVSSSRLSNASRLVTFIFTLPSRVGSRERYLRHFFLYRYEFLRGVTHTLRRFTITRPQRHFFYISSGVSQSRVRANTTHRFTGQTYLLPRGSYGRHNRFLSKLTSPFYSGAIIYTRNRSRFFFGKGTTTSYSYTSLHGRYLGLPRAVRQFNGFIPTYFCLHMSLYIQ